MTGTNVMPTQPMKINDKLHTDTDLTLLDGYANKTPQDGHTNPTTPTPTLRTSTTTNPNIEQLQNTLATLTTADRSHLATKTS